MYIVLEEESSFLKSLRDLYHTSCRLNCKLSPARGWSTFGGNSCDIAIASTCLSAVGGKLVCPATYSPLFYKKCGNGETRTLTLLRELAPEASVYTNFTTFPTLQPTQCITEYVRGKSTNSPPATIRKRMRSDSGGHHLGRR